MQISLNIYVINHISAKALTTGRMIPSGINSPPAEISPSDIINLQVKLHRCFAF